MYIQPQGTSHAKLIGVTMNKLYRLQFNSPKALVRSNSNRDMGEKWNRKMANLHHGALKVLRELVTCLAELSTKHSDVCKGCALGKYSKIAFPSSDSRTTSILELVHSDICGPMSSQSLRGYEYFVTFRDDFSRKTWIYFLRTKDEVFNLFQEFKALVENATGKWIKCFDQTTVVSTQGKPSRSYVSRRESEGSGLFHIALNITGLLNERTKL